MLNQPGKSPFSNIFSVAAAKTKSISLRLVRVGIPQTLDDLQTFEDYLKSNPKTDRSLYQLTLQEGVYMDPKKKIRTKRNLKDLRFSDDKITSQTQYSCPICFRHFNCIWLDHDSDFGLQMLRELHLSHLRFGVQSIKVPFLLESKMQLHRRIAQLGPEDLHRLPRDATSQASNLAKSLINILIHSAYHLQGFDQFIQGPFFIVLWGLKVQGECAQGFWMRTMWFVHNDFFQIC